MEWVYGGYDTPNTVMSFATTESNCSYCTNYKLYKRSRLAQPALPSRVEDADNILRNSRYSQLNGAVFYLGLANPYDLGLSPTKDCRCLRKLKELVPEFAPITTMADKFSTKRHRRLYSCSIRRRKRDVGWRRSVVVSALAWSTKLIDTAPGYYLDGWLLTGR